MRLRSQLDVVNNQGSNSSSRRSGIKHNSMDTPQLPPTTFNTNSPFQRKYPTLNIIITHNYQYCLHCTFHNATTLVNTRRAMKTRGTSRSSITITSFLKHTVKILEIIT
uniref:Uncharacterized protein n=1 Tax=Glossina brevipalpis TaxID=37001 RepID=A0A1A9WAS8_9MUSC